VKGATNSKAVMITLGNCNNKFTSATAYANNVALQNTLLLTVRKLLKSHSVCFIALPECADLFRTLRVVCVIHLRITLYVYCKSFHVKHGFI